MFTNSAGTATTSAATLSVISAPAIITTNPVSQTIVAGSSVTFTAAASGNPIPTVQWQVSTGGGAFTNVSGATSTSYTFSATPAQTANEYRAVFTNSAGTTITSAATLTVQAPPFVLGDFNHDGHVNAADIMPAMQALTNLSGYEAQYGLSAADLQTIGDVNGDGKVNNADLQALLNSLKNSLSAGAPSLLRGDLNQDGHVTAADISAAINALANLAGYQSQYGLTNANLLTIFDINADGKVTNADLQALLISLKGGGGSDNGSGSSVPSDVVNNSAASSGISYQSDSLVLGSAIRNISRTSLPQSGVVANPENQSSAVAAPLPELTNQSIFVGPLETQLSSVLAVKRGLLNQQASRYSPSPYQFRLLPMRSTRLCCRLRMITIGTSSNVAKIVSLRTHLTMIRFQTSLPMQPHGTKA